jgi:hypothetical protein
MRPIVLSLALLVACGPDSVLVDDENAEFADGRTLVQTFEPQHRAPRVDLILVIDDSPSMRSFTERWAENAAAFAFIAEIDEYPADLRIAITTTSVPGPTCAGPRARGGEPILDSCRAHLEDFVGPDELGGDVEDLAAICEQHCSLAEIPRVPSPGGDDHDHDTLALRPWIEAPQNPFGGNLDGVELAEALACASLQGFRGCSYESPIEAAARMVEHMRDPDHPMSEFRRPDARLGIVTVGDEDDCSHPEPSATIFDPAGDRTFWPDPLADAPTSAVCVRAGLECDEQGCELVDHELDGTPTDNPASAVLTPTSRLHDALAAAGELDDPMWLPHIASVGGYRTDGSVFYTPPGPDLSEDEQAYLDGFGVLPGCEGAEPDLRAAPGGRLAAAGTPGAQYSICEADWFVALEAFALKIKDILKVWCVEFDCVDDCVFEEVDYQAVRTPLPSCVRDEAGWTIDPQTQDFVLPADAEACWVMRTDANQLTSDIADDIPLECSNDGHPGEIVVRRRAGSLLPYDSVYQLRCRPC